MEVDVKGILERYTVPVEIEGHPFYAIKMEKLGFKGYKDGGLLVLPEISYEKIFVYVLLNFGKTVDVAEVVSIPIMSSDIEDDLVDLLKYIGEKYKDSPSIFERLKEIMTKRGLKEEEHVRILLLFYTDDETFGVKN